MSIELKVIELLKQKHQISGGNCGLTLTSISNQLDTSSSIIKPILNRLFKNNSITINPGGQGKLVMWKIQ